MMEEDAEEVMPGITSDASHHPHTSPPPLTKQEADDDDDDDDVMMVTPTDNVEIENNESSLSTQQQHSVDNVHQQDDPTTLSPQQPKPVNDSPLADEGSMEPGGPDVAQTTGDDAYIPTHTIDGLHVNCGITDGTAILDSKNHSVCTPPNHESPEANTLDGIRSEVNNVETALESPTNSGTKEEEFTNELTTEGSPLGYDIKVKGIKEGVNMTESLAHNKANEENEEEEEEEEESDEEMEGMERLIDNETKEELSRQELDLEHEVHLKPPQNSFLLEPDDVGGDESGTEMEQVSFMKELETFHKGSCLEFKPPKFYGEPLNCLKLWRSVIRLGGYEQVTSCKLWRQVGESFRPPKTCTTVSWTFRCFYEKALLEYEKYKMRIGELPFTDASFTEPAAAGNQGSVNQASGSGRARRDAAARAMQGWHSQRLLSNGEVGDPIIKDKNSSSLRKREKQLKSIGLLKRKKPSPVERAVKVARMKASKSQLGSMVVDVGPPADWVKINVQRTKDCFEVYALVPGLLREEVRVQSDPAGRLVISGQPEQLDNHWGVTPFKKVVSLPSRIDPHQTSAVVTLHGQLFVRVPFEQSDL